MQAQLRELRGAAQALGRADLAPPADLSDAAAAAVWARSTAPAWIEARRENARSLARAEALLEAPVGEGDPWRDLDEALRALEGELLRSATLRERIAEGRRSMSAKAEKVVQENLNPLVELRGGRLVAAMDPEGLQRLRAELPQWVAGWTAYSWQAWQVDLQRLVERLWSPTRGELPVPPPTMRPLELPAAPPPPDFPELTASADQPGVTGILRHARSALYGVMSLGFLFGLRGQSGESGMTPIMIGAALAAVGYGYVQSRAERLQHRERLTSEIQRRAEQAVQSVLRTWYDRCNDRIQESASQQLHQRRAELVAWVRDEVEPRRLEAAQDRRRRQEEARKAREGLSKIQAAKREYERAKQALVELERGV